MFELTPIVIIIFVATVINFAVSCISWQRRKTKGGMYFALGMMGSTLWTLAAGLDYAATSVSLKIFFATIEAWGYLIALPLFTLFALSFAGYEEWLGKKWVIALALFMPVSSILLITTNGYHGWVWQGFRTAPENVVIFEHGPAFSWILVTSYLLTLTIIISLWLASRHGSEISRRQGRLLLYAILFPVAANLVYLFGVGGVEGVDWTSITFSVTGVLFLRALYGTRLLDLVPIARDKLVKGLSDGMIVLDLQNRIIDINHAAAGMVQSSPAMLVGKILMDVVPPARSFLEQAPEQDFKTELEIGDTSKRYFDLLISPLQDGRNQLTGRLIILREVTLRKENELRLLQLTQAVEQSPVSVVITDLQGNIEYVNPRFTELTGYTQSEILGQNPKIIQSGQTPAYVYQDMWQTIRSGRIWRGELLNKKKNGELYWENEAITSVLDNAGHIVNFIAVKEDITERKQVEAALEQRFLEIQELHKNLQETQAQLVEQQRTLATLDERHRLGRDMHDSVNQSIHSLMLFSDTLIALLQKDQTSKAIDVAQRIQESGRQALKEIRLLVYGTQSQVVDEHTDLVRALEDRLNMVEQRVGIRAEIICDNRFRLSCPPGWNENLYWLIMEGLNNSLKHAQAHHVKVHLRCAEKKLEVEVEDDGAGFDSGHARGGGFGMRTMRERAEILGGTLSVKSAPGHGTHICFSAEIGV